MLPQKQKSLMRWLWFLPGVVLAMIVLVGCQGLTTSPSREVVAATLTAEVTVTKTPEQQQLEETVWVLQSINGEPALTDVKVTLEFALDPNAGRMLKGHTGCNGYGVPYEITSNGLEINRFQLIASAAGCLPESIMEQEKQYYEILRHTSHYGIEGNTLTLRTETGQTLVFLPQK